VSVHVPVLKTPPASEPASAPKPKQEDAVAVVEADAESRREQPDDPIGRLEALTDADMHDFMAQIMPEGTRCSYIMSIVISPRHQGRGVGTALIQHGTRRADEECVFAWVHASEVGAGMFEKQGFEEVRRLAVDLDEFCDGRWWRRRRRGGWRGWREWGRRGRDGESMFLGIW